MVPVSPSGREEAQRLHRGVLHAGQKTTWSIIKPWGLPVTLAEAQETCETCVVCLQEHPRRTVGDSGQVVRRWIPLTWWQVDIIGPLPSSEGYKYAVTGVATGLLAVYPAWHTDCCTGVVMCCLWETPDH